MLNPISPFSPTSPLQALLSLQEQLYPAVVIKDSNVGDLATITEHEGFIVLSGSVPSGTLSITHASCSGLFITLTANNSLKPGDTVVLSGMPSVANRGVGPDPFDLNFSGQAQEVASATATTFVIGSSSAIFDALNTNGTGTITSILWNLSAPVPGAVNEGGDDGKLITFISPNNTTDSITISGLATGFNLALFSGNAGSIFTMHAYNGLWYVASVSSSGSNTPDVIFGSL